VQAFLRAPRARDMHLTRFVSSPRSSRLFASLLWAALVSIQACAGEVQTVTTAIGHVPEAGTGDASDDQALADGDTRDDQSLADGDARSPPIATTPSLHRPTGTVCAEPRAASTGQLLNCYAPYWCPDGGQSGPCVDSNCTGGTNGRCECFEPPTACGTRTICTYDDCTSDADCGAGMACLCRETTLPSGLAATTSAARRTVCVTASCRVDSDCGSGGYCSPSPSPYCTEWFTVEFHCHTPTDECLNDADCGQPNSYCTYDGTRGHWACMTASSCADG
jgi:hypothetical protein